MQLNLLNSFTAILFFVIIGCSTSAPELPNDYSSVDAKLKVDESLFVADDLKKSCDEISTEKKQLMEYRDTINDEINEGRVGDQAAVLLFGLGFMFLDSNADVEEQQKTIQERLDTINLLGRYKQCYSSKGA